MPFFFSLSSQKQHIQIQNCFYISLSRDQAQYKHDLVLSFLGRHWQCSPDPFTLSVRLECRVFLIPVKTDPLMETVLHLSPERNTRRLLDSVCLCR